MFNKLATYSIKNIYTVDQTADLKLICSKGINNTYKRGAFTLLLLFISINIGMAGPMYVQFKYGTRITLTASRIPFFDEYSDAEYFINVTIQTTIGLFGFFGNILLEVWFH